MGNFQQVGFNEQLLFIKFEREILTKISTLRVGA